MSAVAVLLIAVGIADACSRSTRVVWLTVAVGPVVVAVCAALGALWHVGDIVLLALAAAATVAWQLLCARSERTGAHHLAPLVVFGASLGLLMVLSGLGCEVGGAVARWSKWVALPFNDFPPTRLLMIVGVVLLQFATGNRLVRQVLASVGAVRPVGEPQPSDRLKGGRLLGPNGASADPEPWRGWTGGRSQRRRRRQGHHSSPGIELPEEQQRQHDRRRY